MEPRFIVRFSPDERFYLALARHIMGRRFALMAGFCAALTLCFLYGGVRAGSVVDRASWVIAACVPGFFCISYLLGPKRVARRSARQDAGKNPETTLQFIEDSAVISGSHEEDRLRYAIFDRLDETETTFYLFFNKDRFYVVPKNAFVAGDPADFAAFIEAKCGLRRRLSRY